jgi:hypothetical protein
MLRISENTLYGGSPRLYVPYSKVGHGSEVAQVS